VNRHDEIVTVLKNGMAVICKRVPTSPVLAVRGYVFTGGVFEGKWLRGGPSPPPQHPLARRAPPPPPPAPKPRPPPAHRHHLHRLPHPPPPPLLHQPPPRQPRPRHRPAHRLAARRQDHPRGVPPRIPGRPARAREGQGRARPPARVPVQHEPVSGQP